MTPDPGAPEFPTPRRGPAPRPAGRDLVARLSLPFRARAAVNGALDFYLTPGVKFLWLVSAGSFLILKLSLWIAPDSAPALIDRFLALNGRHSLLFIWEFITHLFAHTGTGHLLIDLAVIALIGPELEIRWGESRFLRFFLSVGVGGALLHHLAAFLLGVAVAPALGFTGVLFGMMLAYGVYFPSRRFLLFHAFPLPVSVVIPVAMAAGGLFLPRVSYHVSNLLNAACLLMALVYLADYHRTWDLRVWRYLR